MRIKIFIDKSIHENAAYYYELAKETKAKIEGVQKAIEETKKAIASAEKARKTKKVRVKRKKEWYEAFHFFFTSGGKLAIGGKDQKQNEIVFRKHMEDNDLFFHADIQGGSAVVLKDGAKATEQEKKEAAQFAASFSNAWKNANAAVDVYAVRKNQVSQYAQGGYVAAGAFAITGAREWFKSTALGLKIGKEGDRVFVLPLSHSKKLEKEIALFPSKKGKEKEDAAKYLAYNLEADIDDIRGILPSGKILVKI